MYTPDTRTNAPAAGGRWTSPGSVMVDLTVASGAAMILCLAVYALLPASPTLPVLAMLLTLGGAGFLASLARRLPGGRLGAANRVTLGRAVLALPVIVLTPFPAALTDTGSWLVVGFAAAVLSLDGVDGWVARHTGTASAFGARFDMELDALLLLALSLLVWQAGQVGAWVILIGGMRYAFVAAGWLFPWLTRPLPPSLRRKTACVVQGVVLAVIVAPVIPGWLASAAAMFALLSLAASFAADIAWLLRHRRDAGLGVP